MSTRLSRTGATLRSPGPRSENRQSFAREELVSRRPVPADTPLIVRHDDELDDRRLLDVEEKCREFGKVQGERAAPVRTQDRLRDVPRRDLASVDLDAIKAKSGEERADGEKSLETAQVVRRETASAGTVKRQVQDRIQSRPALPGRENGKRFDVVNRQMRESAEWQRIENVQDSSKLQQRVRSMRVEVGESETKIS
ncbi:hypothetical protein AAT19DRAFT_13123 [Rhodotorula toruloides]|uniref:Uncharacterized protein n=1 Tax=Rhodotorula toruloides TaxID=5286 RepID=A0A2T0ADM0_RHOTO|nr:hypothetical protein AAT19DRAFT_13123 [Rhodotorula toruloides]